MMYGEGYEGRIKFLQDSIFYIKMFTSIDIPSDHPFIQVVNPIKINSMYQMTNAFPALVLRKPKSKYMHPNSFLQLVRNRTEIDSLG